VQYGRITRSASWQQDEGIVQPVPKGADRLSRRLHHFSGHLAVAVFFSAARCVDCGMAHAIKVNDLAAELAAYLAGLIDGEGTVTLTRLHRGENRRLVVSVSNNDFSLLNFVRAAIGAGRIATKRTYSARHAPSFTYQISSRQALDLLRQVTPYLGTYRAKRAARIERVSASDPEKRPVPPYGCRLSSRVRTAVTGD